jgi:hypothetical protein
MATKLFRNIIKKIFRTKDPQSIPNIQTPKRQVNIDVDKSSSPGINPNPPQRQGFYPNSVSVRDVTTGEYSEAEVIDGNIENSIEKISHIPNKPPSQLDAVKLRAKNETYIKAVKGLMVMNLDADIFTDAMGELREKYYGKAELPNEVVVIVENLTQKKSYKQ